jgi:hypothetical protein
VVEHAALARVVLSRDVDARLLVEPPRRQPEFRRNQRLRIASRACYVTAPGTLARVQSWMHRAFHE